MVRAADGSESVLAKGALGLARSGEAFVWSWAALYIIGLPPYCDGLHA